MGNTVEVSISNTMFIAVFIIMQNYTSIHME